jgi:uncharacterized membrane protein YjjP (DUF1212 family)
MNEKIFPTVLMIVNIAAAVVYLVNGDWKRALYWFSACVLTFTVTY